MAPPPRAAPYPGSSGPPYLPLTAAVGGTPTVNTDIPICAIFLFFYLTSAIANQIIFQRNRRRKHKFYIIWALFGFSMARVMTMTLRIVWAERKDNPHIQIAAGIFLNAGIIILYIVNLLLALRILRSVHPTLGWNPWLRKGLRLSYSVLGVVFACAIAFLVTSYYTRNETILKAALWISRITGIYLLIFALAPVAMYGISLYMHMATGTSAESFGAGATSSKYAILGVSLASAVLIEGFRFAMAWVPPRPFNDPAWYHSKPALYSIEFLPEIIAVYTYIMTRIDKRFWVPDGSNGPGDYSRGVPKSQDCEFGQLVPKAAGNSPP